MPTSRSTNPEVSSGSCLCVMAINPELPDSLDNKTSSGQLGACTAVGHSSQGSGSSPWYLASSAGLVKVVVSSSSVTSSMDTLNSHPSQ